MTGVCELPEQVVAVLLGLAVGSFLNVLSLRSLTGQSVLWPPSHCPNCQHRLSPLDNLPLVSYLLLRGRCRWCQGKISWQYPLVEAICALMFWLFYNHFGLTWYALGMVVFGCTLITVSITDFREKLIPHDITYPSLLLGILFSCLVRHDTLGSLAGIGASYILFDFLAHYGSKIYTAAKMSGPAQAIGQDSPSLGATAEIEPAIKEVFQADNPTNEQLPAGELEVMGGGDAVLSAVISAWLGWTPLVVAIIVGFLVGTIMGVIYLLREMHQAKMLPECIRPTLLGTLLGFLVMAAPSYLLGSLSEQPGLSWLPFGLLGAAAGALVGIVSVGTRVSRPFPFGPALALGGFVAIFWDPLGWLLKAGA